ncbi:MAG: CPBP family intramembrane metalloprotease [Xanthomonadaceae bacterium]|nr:CPBP family intramembrane metalloprotease [Xanthomonadaceae bacterium]MDE1962809.1 CPBP family intramembrane metalloprotease [Xanthomonadaceae bacterium]
MNAASDALPASPPPLLPAPERVPGVLEALALLVLYFCLQLVIGFGAAILASFVAGAGISFSRAGAGPDNHSEHLLLPAMADPDLRTAVTAVTLLLAATATLWLVHRRWPRRWRLGQAWQGFGFAPAAQPAFYATALALGVGVPVFGGLLTHWLAGDQPVTQAISQLGHASSLGERIALAGLAVSLGPLVEETLFRGVLFTSLLDFRRRTPIQTTPGTVRVAMAMLVSAALFATVHLPDLGWRWYALPNLALLGLGCAWLRLHSGSLWPSVVAHGVNNLLAVAGWFIVAHPVG